MRNIQKDIKYRKYIEDRRKKNSIKLASLRETARSGLPSNGYEVRILGEWIGFSLYSVEEIENKDYVPIYTTENVGRECISYNIRLTRCIRVLPKDIVYMGPIKVRLDLKAIARNSENSE